MTSLIGAIDSNNRSRPLLNIRPIGGRVFKVTRGLTKINRLLGSPDASRGEALHLTIRILEVAAAVLVDVGDG